jgi:hypothetical protein
LQGVARPLDDRRFELQDRGDGTVGVAGSECRVELGFVELRGSAVTSRC